MRQNTLGNILQPHQKEKQSQIDRKKKASDG